MMANKNGPPILALLPMQILLRLLSGATQDLAIGIQKRRENALRVRTFFFLMRARAPKRKLRARALKIHALLYNTFKSLSEPL